MGVDRPASIEAATARIEAEGLTTRCRLVSADLPTAVPAGADVYVMKHVLHGFTDDRAVTILRNRRAAMESEGRLPVIEFVLPAVVDVWMRIWSSG